MNGRATSFVLRWGLRLLGATWRYREQWVGAPAADTPHADVPNTDVPNTDVPNTDVPNAPAVIAFWHGAMLPVWYRYRRRGATALVSASPDGALLAGYLERSLRYERVIRGSSSRGGSEALALVVEALAERPCLITPDGPRGPARQAKAGALVAAQRAGVPVVAVGWWCRRAVRLRSWDGMRIPLPFSIINFRYCIFDLSTERNHRIDDATLARFQETLNATMTPPGVPLAPSVPATDVDAERDAASAGRASQAGASRAHQHDEQSRGGELYSGDNQS